MRSISDGDEVRGNLGADSGRVSVVNNRTHLNNSCHGNCCAYPSVDQ